MTLESVALNKRQKADFTFTKSDKLPDRVVGKELEFKKRNMKKGCPARERFTMGMAKAIPERELFKHWFPI